MLTRDELQDEVDELRLALEETREAAESDLGEARRENSRLREELGRSESQRSQLHSTLATLNETQQSLADLYGEKEQRLLARVAEASAKMGAAGERWAAEKARLREELERSEARVTELEEEDERRRKQLSTQAGWVVQLQQDLGEAKRLSEFKDQKIRGYETQLARSGEELRRVSEAKGESLILGLLEMLSSRPGCWAVIVFLVTIAAGITYVINSILDWLKPSDPLLGR